VVYDVLRGFEHLKISTEQDIENLQAGLELLMKYYSNVEELLRNRFNPTMLRYDAT